MSQTKIFPGSTVSNLDKCKDDIYYDCNAINLLFCHIVRFPFFLCTGFDPGPLPKTSDVLSMSCYKLLSLFSSIVGHS